MAAYLVSVAYALSWPIAAALNFNFHEVAFAPALTAVALERLQAGRLRTALIALAALLLVKEDMGLLVAGIGLYLLVARPGVVPRQRLVAAALIVAGIADTVLATYVLIPAFGGRSDYYWAYTSLGSNAGPGGMAPAHPPSQLAAAAGHAAGQAHHQCYGCSGRSASCRCSRPSRLRWSRSCSSACSDRCSPTGGPPPSSTTPSWWWCWCAPPSTAPPGSIVGLRGPGSGQAALTEDAAAGGRADRAGAGAGVVALGCAVAMCALAVCLVPQFHFRAALHPSFFQRDARMNAAAAAVAHVPSGVTVEAVNYLGPALSARDTVLLWDGDGSSPLRPPWVVADTAKRQFTFSNRGQQRKRVAFLKRTGYRVVFRERGYIVLRAPSAGTSGRAAG